jgi:hypothetical protein
LGIGISLSSDQARLETPLAKQYIELHATVAAMFLLRP